MNEVLEAFERIKSHLLSYVGSTYKETTDSREQQIKDLEIVEETIKAFNIINEKNVDIVYLRSQCYCLEHYNEYCPFEIEEDEKLTQKEFDLLKKMTS